MELTPELFETTEFTERRKGYDIDQVETFLEQTGTALAQLLARTRHTEERAAHAEARLAQADAAIAEAQQRVQAAEQRVQAAEQAAQGAAAAAASTARLNEEAEVEQAAKTLLMAKRTADATVNEARGQAQALLEDSQNRAQRQLNEANAEAAELIRRANEQAEAEFADRRSAVLEEVRGLEARRAQLADVIAQLESRLAGYREELGRTAEEIVALAQDPSRLGARPNMSMAPDEVLSSDPTPDGGEAAPAPEQPAAEEPVAVEPVAVEPAAASANDSGRADSAEVGVAAEEPSVQEPSTQEPSGRGATEAAPSAGPASAEASATVGGTATALMAEPMTEVADEGDAHYVDLTAPAPAAGEVAADDRWGPGSWAEVEREMQSDADVTQDGAAERPVDQPTEAVGRADVPRDRYMEELDSAVNEAVSIDEDDAAMTAFFQGTSDSRSRRFGWRR
jgi:cell division septum initiation protein DivIVA